MSSFRYLLPQIAACFNLRKNSKTLYLRASNRYAALDGIRALSILPVIIFHALMSIGAKIGDEEFQLYLESLPWYLNWILQGDKGVDSFFVLSGFLIGSMLINEWNKTGKIRFGSFYYRRFLRLSPLYWILLLMILPAPMEVDKIYLWANLFYLNNFLEADQLLAGWTWSLAVEEQFYMIFPLMLALWFYKSNNRLLILIFLFALSFPIRYALIISDNNYLTIGYIGLLNYEDFFTTVYDNLYSRYGALVAGVIAAYLHHHHTEKLKDFFTDQSLLANAILALSLALILTLLNLPVYLWTGEEYASLTLTFHTISRNVFALCVAYILLATLYGNALCSILASFLSWRIWLPIAQLAYALYLFHPILILPAEEIVARTLSEEGQYSIAHLFQISGITLGICLIICGITYLLIEKPFMNMRNIQWKNSGDK